MRVGFQLAKVPGDKMAERSKVMTRVRSYWEGLRHEGALPQRADIDPRALPDCLANVFLIERVSSDITRFRIAGAVLSEVMGMDVRGMPFLALIEPAERSALARRVEQVFQDPSILDLRLESGVGVRLGARVALLPVQSRHGIDMALGCLTTEGLVGATPRRFRPVRALQERILDGAPRRVGFADPAAPFDASPTRPALRLVYSSDHKISKDDDDEK